MLKGNEQEAPLYEIFYPSLSLPPFGPNILHFDLEYPQSTFFWTSKGETFIPV
jgi:hypothetical protein